MPKYYAIYKCPLCGTLLKTTENTIEIPYDELPKLLGKYIRTQQFAGNPYLYEAPSHIPCKCKDGSAGLAAFAGFKRVDSFNHTSTNDIIKRKRGLLLPWKNKD